MSELAGLILDNVHYRMLFAVDGSKWQNSVVELICAIES